jgi:hypothetical protein
MAKPGNAKDIVSDASLEIGITLKPVSTVASSNDQDIVQMLALLSTVADEVLLEEPYKYILGDEVWCTDKDGKPKEKPTTDTDLILFDKRLAINGLKYRFLKAKGLEFGEEQRDFITRMNKIAARDAPVIDLDEDEGVVR